MKRTDIEIESAIYPEMGQYKDGFGRKNEEVLLDILQRNRDTEFGRSHGFGAITDEKQYREKVSVSGYSAYRDMIRRMREGEKNILTADPVYCYLKTSGSTEAGKVFPITVEALKRYGDTMDRYMAHRAGNGKRFFLSLLFGDTDHRCRPEETMIFTSACYRYMYEQGRLDMTRMAGGKELLFYKDSCDYLYVKLWLAFAEPDIVSMETVYMYDFLLFFQYMEDHYAEVLADMEAGNVPEDRGLPESIRQALSGLTVSKDRIETIRRECEKGFQNIVPRLWEKMQLVSGIGSKAFQVEEISVLKYIGALPVWHYIYAASECLMGVPVAENSYDYVLFPRGAYFEFRETEKGREEENRILSAAELVVGRSYEPILTTYSGLYRYGMGDVLKLTGFYGDLPIFCFRHRRNLVLNIAGEKLDMEILDRAVRYWSRDRKRPVWQYFFSEDYHSVPACYRGVIALDHDAGDLEPGEETAYLDKLLRRLCTDYDELRDLGSIAMPDLAFVDKAEFMGYLSIRKSTEGQTKPQHIFREK